MEHFLLFRSLLFLLFIIIIIFLDKEISILQLAVLTRTTSGTVLSQQMEEFESSGTKRGLGTLWEVPRGAGS